VVIAARCGAADFSPGGTFQRMMQALESRRLVTLPGCRHISHALEQ
jgi:hypothetical protein